MEIENTPRNFKEFSPNIVIKELTVSSILIGIIVGVVMTAANVYLGLYAGMTVSASIPAAVISMAIYRGLLKQSCIYQSNIVQTMASAGESLAAGVIFTVPALVLVGAWNKFEFWPTTLIAISGGLLGVVFMIPLRRTLIVEQKELTYPEGVACASVLRAGTSDDGAGIRQILHGLLIGGVFKVLSTGLGIFKGSVEVAMRIGNPVFFAGTDISPALLAVGYIVSLEIAALVFIGGVIGWVIGIPLLGVPADMQSASALDVAWTLWSTKIRYLGVGAMIVGGLASIVSVRKGIFAGLQGIRGYKAGDESDHVPRTEHNMALIPLGIIFALCLMTMFGLYQYLINNLMITALTTMLMLVASFVFVAVASYICGLVGSSNNPVSGITISALLGTSAVFLVLGFEGQSAILATLGVAAVVCCAACTAGDCSQDLKTGQIIGATPRNQQIAQMIGIVIPAMVIAPVLTLLHSAYGIGTGLKAPQATLFASITRGIFGDGTLPINMVLGGMVLGLIIHFADQFLRTKGYKFRLHLMPLAVGIYLPITLAVPILIGGVIRNLVDRRRVVKENEADSGVLLGSGLIAGEAIIGVVIAVFLYFKVDLAVSIWSDHVAEIVSLLAFAALAVFTYRQSLKNS